jgi:hypothetical protein
MRRYQTQKNAGKMTGHIKCRIENVKCRMENGKDKKIGKRLKVKGERKRLG